MGGLGWGGGGCEGRGGEGRRGKGEGWGRRVRDMKTYDYTICYWQGDVVKICKNSYTYYVHTYIP